MTRQRIMAGARASGVLLAAISVAIIMLEACAGTGGSEPYRMVAQGNADSGKVAINWFGCGSCHMIPGIRDAQGVVGPPLTAFGRRVYIAGEVPNTSENLVQWLEVPQSIEPGTAMPNLGVTEGEARDIAAYLYTLR